MALDIENTNKRFLHFFNRDDQRTLNLAARYGVTIKKAEVEPGELYWACVGVKHLTGDENMGNHNMYCDVLGHDRKRINRAKLVMMQGNQAPVYAVIDKPPHEAGTNFPVWGETPCDISVEYHDLPSDEVKGLRINHADEEKGNTIGHHSFYILWGIFKKVKYKPINRPVPRPVPPVDEGGDEVKKPTTGPATGVVKVENLTIDIEGSDYEVDLVIVVKHKHKRS